MRPRVVQSIVFVLGFVGVWLGGAADARACSCAYLGSPAERIDHASVVFRGTVTEVDVSWTLRPKGDGELGDIRINLALLSHASVTAVLEVHEAWRGVDQREIEVDLGDGLCCNCSLGAALEVGEELLVFAYEHEDGVLHVSGCNPPMPIEDAGPDLEFLGPGEQALERGRRGGERRTFMLLAIGFALALAMPLAMYFREPR